MPSDYLSGSPSEPSTMLHLDQVQLENQSTMSLSRVKRASIRCPVCQAEMDAGVTLSQARRREIMMTLRAAIIRWLFASGRSVVAVAERADVSRSRLNRFLYNPEMTTGPKVDFYRSLLAVEEQHRGYFDPLVVRLLRVLSNYYVEQS